MTKSRVTRIALLAIVICGCGPAVTPDYPHLLVGAEGQLLVLEDLEAIANDPNLDDGQKRDRFRDLGIEDEQLIDALLGL